MKMAWAKPLSNAKIEYVNKRYRLVADEGTFDVEYEIVVPMRRVVRLMYDSISQEECDNFYNYSLLVAKLDGDIAGKGDWLAITLAGCGCGSEDRLRDMFILFETMTGLCRAADTLAKICEQKSVFQLSG